jgi:MYXO-CTERM domain-containing protein
MIVASGRRAAGRVLFLSLLIGGCTAETSPFDHPEEAPPPSGALRGELVTYTATFDDGTSDQQYFLRVNGDERDERKLLFTRDPDLPSGTRMDVWGAEEHGQIQVQRFELLRRSLASVQQALINGSSYRPRTFAFVLVDVGGGVGTLPKEEFTKRLFGTDVMTTPSVRQYYIEASYGRQDVGGQVFGPLNFTMTGCNTSALATALRPMIPGTYDHYLWYLGSRVSACSWSGLASSGMPDRPSRDTWYNASSGCVVLVQEPGHNFGMKHSSFMKCPNASFVDKPYDTATMTSTCMHSEYGDRYDPMGSGCRHMNSYQKAYQGWFGKCNVVDVTATGTFNLLPLELPCDGIQVLQVPMPHIRPFYRSGGGGSAGVTELTHYFLEFRASTGIDRGLAPSVQVRVSGDIKMRTQRGLNTWFLDMNPATSTLDGLVAGGSFTDPAGSVKFTVDSIEPTRATVRVEFEGGGMGAPKCMDDSLLEAPGPGPESCSATPAVPNGATPVPTDGGASPIGSGGAGGGGGTGGARDGGSTGGSPGSGGRGGSGGTDVRPATSSDGASSDAPSTSSGTGGTAGAGSGGQSGSGTGGASSSGGASGSGGKQGENLVAGGCACHLGGQPGDRAAVPAGAPALLALFALVLRRRRR